MEKKQRQACLSAVFFSYLCSLSGCGAVGSALGLGPRCRTFESCHPDLYTGALPQTPRLPALVLLLCELPAYSSSCCKSTGLRRSADADKKKRLRPLFSYPLLRIRSMPVIAGIFQGVDGGGDTLAFGSGPPGLIGFKHFFLHFFVIDIPGRTACILFLDERIL